MLVNVAYCFLKCFFSILPEVSEMLPDFQLFGRWTFSPFKFHVLLSLRKACFPKKFQLMKLSVSPLTLTLTPVLKRWKQKKKYCYNLPIWHKGKTLSWLLSLGFPGGWREIKRKITWSTLQRLFMCGPSSPGNMEACAVFYKYQSAGSSTSK